MILVSESTEITCLWTYSLWRLQCQWRSIQYLVLAAPLLRQCRPPCRHHGPV